MDQEKGHSHRLWWSVQSACCAPCPRVQRVL